MYKVIKIVIIMGILSSIFSVKNKKLCQSLEL